MIEGTKERILRIALELFAQNGYLGTSMNDIAGQLGFTKAALYKHYTSKQEILDKIVERMNQMDYERAAEYEMPETEPDGFAEAYLHTPVQKIRTYSMAQFDHWTKEPFSSNFRKMLTLEQYRDPKLAQLHHDYLAGGPLEYMAAIFRKMTDSDEDAMQLALEFYGPMYLLYSVYFSSSYVDDKRLHVAVRFRLGQGMIFHMFTALDSIIGEADTVFGFRLAADGRTRFILIVKESCPGVHPEHVLFWISEAVMAGRCYFQCVQYLYG